MKFDVLTLFPEFFLSPFNQSIIKRASGKGLLDLSIHNIRDYTTDKHKTTDDAPYGGGAGMLMKVEPIVSAIESLNSGFTDGVVILLTPQGRVLDQKLVSKLAKHDRIMIICGRYEGVDERVKGFVDMEVSIGDYVLMGGEVPAMAIIESVARFIPGVLGCDESKEIESFSEGLLEYPQYTRPQDFRGLKVPPVLLSGNHEKIRQWRMNESRQRTLNRRPDLVGVVESSNDKDKMFH